MKPEIKQQWVDALRSGKYEQGKGFLRSTDDKFCCLGVLCDIYQKEHSDVEWENFVDTTFDINTYNIHNSTGFLPEEVVEWAGLNSDTPYITIDAENPTSLVFLNDQGTPFSTIAELIENNL